MNLSLSPSIMCADFGHLSKEINDLSAAGADVFHMDIMDGEFVPNFALSWHDFKAVRQHTHKPLEAHLMVKKPEVYLPYAFENKAETVYIHYESGNAKTHLQAIRANGVKAGLAVNPETRVDDFQELLPLVDKLLVMRVHPGFASQSAVPEVEEKIEQLMQIKNRSFQIVLDGSVSQEVIAKWSPQGVEAFVLGTACGMFGSKRAGRSYSEIMNEIRAIHRSVNG